MGFIISRKIPLAHLEVAEAQILREVEQLKRDEEYYDASNDYNFSEFFFASHRHVTALGVAEVVTTFFADFLRATLLLL